MLSGTICGNNLRPFEGAVLTHFAVETAELESLGLLRLSLRIEFESVSEHL